MGRVITVPVLLIINSGSSSLKFSVYRLDTPLQARFRGKITAIGASGYLQIFDDKGQVVREQSVNVTDHEQALQLVIDWLINADGAFEIVAAGHRVVHGGTRFYAPVLVSEEVIDYLHSLIALAPNHQPPSLTGMAALQTLRPGLMQVACFDTAFHHHLPDVEQKFALPARPELDAVRRYGFHGLSYEYIAKVLPEHIGSMAEGRVIVAHLGHGASLCAMRERRSVATTMTFTPLDGLPMGTRCGSIDPAVVLYLLQQGMSADSISDLLYFQSGLLGVSGISDDMAELLESKIPAAAQAIEQFIHQTVRAIGSLSAALQGLDALIFTAGIGEHSVAIREAICLRCEWLGLQPDLDANRAGKSCISRADSPVQAWVIATDEEQMIAEQTFSVFNAHL